jgi:hypothetical protein
LAGDAAAHIGRVAEEVPAEGVRSAGAALIDHDDIAPDAHGMAGADRRQVGDCSYEAAGQQEKRARA